MNIPKKYFIDPTLLNKFESKYLDKVDWDHISIYQKLSEEFIERFQDKVDWDYISAYQKLSEKFIEKFQDKVDWDYISVYQNLSEKFIEKFKDKVNWMRISVHQKLSEEFIERFQDKVSWIRISTYQKLSEEFIEKFQDKVDWDQISTHQKLSEEFIEKFKDKVDVNIQLKIFKERSFDECKLEMIEYAKKYNLKFEDDHLYAYRQHDKNNCGYYNKTIYYDTIGKKYEDWHCNMNPSIENSFGLGIWTDGNVKVKVHVSDWGCAVDDNGKARVKAFTLIEKNNE